MARRATKNSSKWLKRASDTHQNLIIFIYNQPEDLVGCCRSPLRHNQEISKYLKYALVASSRCCMPTEVLSTCLCPVLESSSNPH